MAVVVVVPNAHSHCTAQCTTDDDDDDGPGRLAHSEMTTDESANT